MEKRKDMNDEKRLAIIREYLETSKSKAQIQHERGLSKNAISKWLCKFAIEDKPTNRIPMQKPKELPTPKEPWDQMMRLPVLKKSCI